jgi:multidrug resistance protein, MATE family
MATTALFAGSAASILLWTAPHAIIAIYIDADDPVNGAVVAIATRLFMIAALMQVFDGLQAVAAGALRGYKDTTTPMLLAALGYWGVGFTSSWVLGFPLGFGPVGLWWGILLGTAAVAVLLTLRLYRVGRSRPGATPG